MNIYLVNRYSKLKGPFDIIDSNRQHIIKVGDICLRETDGGVDFLVVFNSSNNWSSCKLVGTGNNEILSEIGNTLLFSFDGLSQRKGIIPLIKQLALCYREKVIIDFLNNAIDILEYRKDFWDGYLFPQFFADSQELIEIDKGTKTKETPESIHYPSVFAKYLSNELLDILNAKLSEGHGLKESYLVLREKDPKQFRTSLMMFLAENPNGSIYDLQQSLTENNTNSDEESQIEAPSQVQETMHHGHVDNDIQSFIFYDYDNKKFNQLLQQFHKGDKHALDKLIKMNLKLVAIIADSYKDLGAEYEDLMQEGSIGLIKAINHFYPKQNVQFPAYARWVVQQSISNALIKMQSMVKIPYNQVSLYNKLRRNIESYEQEHGYEPSASDLIIEDNADEGNIAFLTSLPDSLHKLTTGSVDIDTFPSNGPETDDILMRESQTHFINSILGKLSPREANILRRVYGIGVNSESLSEIGEKMGLTRERIRQISEKAVRKLRGILKMHNNESENEPSEIKDSNKNDTTTTSISLKKILEYHRKKKNVQLQSPKLETNTESTKNIFPSKVQHNLYSNIENKEKVKKKEESIKANNTVEVGDVIIYASRKCVVQNINAISNRLTIQYEDGTIDNIKNDIKESQIVGRINTKHVFTKNESESNEKNGPEIEHAYIDIPYSHLDKEDVSIEQNNVLERTNHTSEGGKNDVDSEIKSDFIWHFADNVRNSKRSKRFLNHKCRIVLSKTGYYLNLKNKFIKLGVFPLGFEYNAGSIWIKKPNNSKGWQLIHEIDNNKYTIGYIRERGNTIVYTTQNNVEYKLTINGNVILGVKDVEVSLLKEEDLYKLWHAFDKKATSYKFFWFLAILHIYNNTGIETISFDTILIKMVSLAWKYVFIERCEFPHSDQLPTYIGNIQKRSSLNQKSKENDIENVVREIYHEMKWNTLLKPLLNNVPYRFLSPWIPFTDNEDVIEKSSNPEIRSIYILHDSCIMINPIWGSYLIEYFNKITIFIEKELRLYLKCK